MAEESKPTSALAKGLPSLLESFVEMRFLILIICFAYYLDIWFINHQIDPTLLTIEMAYKSLLSTSVFSLLMFICSYSILMVGFFPTFRKLLPIIVMIFKSSIRITNHTKEEIQLANWSMALIWFSSFSFISGLLTTEGEYSGLTHYIFGLLESNGLIEIVFRLCALFFWLYCLALAFSYDGYSV